MKITMTSEQIIEMIDTFIKEAREKALTKDIERIERVAALETIIAYQQLKVRIISFEEKLNYKSEEVDNG